MPQMTIKVGDALPDVTVKTWDDGPADLSIGELTAGKTAVIFGLPGAFTPTCSIRHLPGFVDHVDALKAKGVDLIAVHSVNDPHVMNAWNKQQGSEEIETRNPGAEHRTRILERFRRSLSINCYSNSGGSYRPGQIQVAGDRFQNRAKYPIKSA